MTEILFEHDKWTVVTSSWTVASKGDGIVICYPWSGLSGFSMWGNSATGVARIEFYDISMIEFLNRTKNSGRVDLRRRT